MLYIKDFQVLGTGENIFFGGSKASPNVTVGWDGNNLAFVGTARTGNNGSNEWGATITMDQEVLSGTKAYRQGVLQIGINRAAAQADTTWDGNPDCAFKVIATNRATGNLAGQGGIRGMDIQGRNRGTNIGEVNSAQFNARNDSGMQAVSLYVLKLRAENYGNIGTDLVGINVELSDENSNVDPHTKHGILVRNTDASGMGAVDAAIKLSHTSTNGFTAFAELAASGDGYAAASNAVSSGTTEALVVKIGANLRYIPCYAAATF